MQYVFIDEIQLVVNIDNPYINDGVAKIGFVDVLLGLMKLKNVDLYVTGSNSKMLSSDILTEFKDRGDEIKVYPLSYMDAFIINRAFRYDVKGRKYMNTPLKYYFTDVGLRNARLNFRQMEENHIMENIIYNELVLREFNVDVGIVESFYRDKSGKLMRKQLEIDFIANKGEQTLLYSISFNN